MVFFFINSFFLISNSQFNFELSCNLDLLTLVFFFVCGFLKKRILELQYTEKYIQYSSLISIIHLSCDNVAVSHFFKMLIFF